MQGENNVYQEACVTSCYTEKELYQNPKENVNMNAMISAEAELMALMLSRSLLWRGT
jgi:hypothetical protein